PLVADVLLEPNDLTSVSIDREGRGLIEVFSIRIVRTKDELGVRCRYRRTRENQVQFRIIAWRNPAADVTASFVGDIAPGFVACLTGTRDGVEAPEFFTGRQIVRSDEAGFRATHGTAGTARDRLATSNNRTRTLEVAGHLIVGDLGFPLYSACLGVQSHQPAVWSGKNHQVFVQRNVAGNIVDGSVLSEISGNVATVFPD